MADILHRIGTTTTTPDRVYDALTTIDGLAGWWTTDTTGSAAPGGTIQFRFGPPGGFDMKVLDQRPQPAGPVGGHQRPRGVDRHPRHL